MRQLLDEDPRELTGVDASVDEAEGDDVWMGVGAEEELARDIAPDQVRYLGKRNAVEEEDEEREITARPLERPHALFY